ncbi:hypothetical protein FISHEDRAFT_44064 [Fistulina hepatica ATCC 64428]|uniref:Clathrin light chain n=1 Tax=Fistulina hepatica ATCC 64428 TaxID=1128425 RepID=A0A0D7ABI8_9AGAR|nr:hypothetical protein FISHEDRAFT_44064 [Fistulina hepatica ATCC 64428]
MADFLAGEFSTKKANDEIDFDAAAAAFPDISLDGESDFPAVLPTTSAAPPPPQAGGFSFDDFEPEPVANPPVKVTGDDEIGQFESQFPDIEVPQVRYASKRDPSFTSPPAAPRPQPSAFASTPILNQAMEEEEPEVIRQWRERQAEDIRARDEASKARRQETISKAEKAIDDFYEEYAKKKERNIAENKDQEQEYLANMNSSLTVGTTWERICDLIELQNSQSKTIARAGAGTTELGRFKEVLLKIKREGDRAPGAAGY